MKCLISQNTLDEEEGWVREKTKSYQMVITGDVGGIRPLGIVELLVLLLCCSSLPVILGGWHSSAKSV